jgi:hypothetical protein
LKYTFKVYSIAHGVPLMLYKRKEIFLNPKQSLKSLMISILKSMGFFSGFIMAMRAISCLSSNIRQKFDILTLICISFFSTLPVLIENVKRMEDYTLFTLPRVLEGIWDLFAKLGYLKNIPNSLNFMFAVSMGILLVCKKHFEKYMPKSYSRHLDHIIGINNN